MSFDLYDASAPVFINALANMRAWLDKAAASGSETELMAAQLAPDMRPLPAQFQMASDSAKNAIARLAGTEAPSMPDTEASFDDLRTRCDKTIAYIKSADADMIRGSEDREVILKFPNGMGYRFNGSAYLTG